MNFTGSYTDGEPENYFFMLRSQFPTALVCNLFKMSGITLSGNTSDMSFPILLKYQLMRCFVVWRIRSNRKKEKQMSIKTACRLHVPFSSRSCDKFAARMVVMK